MSDEVEPKRRKHGWGGKREGAGRKPFADSMYTLSVYLSDLENEAAHFLAVDQGLPISRCIGNLIMKAYRERVHRVTKGE